MLRNAKKEEAVMSYDDTGNEIKSAVLAERERCAQVAQTYARELSKGIHARCGSIEEIGVRIAAEISKPVL